jgi:hypothetical protein
MNPTAIFRGWFPSSSTNVVTGIIELLNPLTN